MILLDEPITKLKGIGDNRAKLLGKLGINSIEDLLYYFPRAMEDRSGFTPIYELEDGENACIIAEVFTKVQEMRVRKNLIIYTMLVKDNSGSANIVWYNNRFVKDIFKIGDIYKFYGKVTIKHGKREISSPTYETQDSNLHTGRVVPVYPLTENLYQKNIRSIMKQCIESVAGNINEYIPQNIREKYNLCEINFALAQVHFPDSGENYEIARKRLVFEELLMMQLGLLHMRSAGNDKEGIPLEISPYEEEFYNLLPFKLTGAQMRVIKEICSDMSGMKPMSRLVQGDVGSGKTVVAFAAMYIGVKNGMQTALMAPTEVLAFQHYTTAQAYFESEEIALLTGSVTGKERIKALEDIKSGKAKVIIGTHAVIENNVEFKNLCLAITDEQHRFGVRQRAMLTGKGESPHVLIMSATPIPRTLALILYGDLDISAVDEMPPGRMPVETFVVDEDMRGRINNFIKKNIDEGRQVFIICPLVEESEKLDLKAATELAEHLKSNVLTEYKTELLHGKMKPKQKNDIMDRFSKGEINVLVSTTVIEVGVNVPNATIMIVENAERFGLAQLHQIRGRVGRGNEKSYCILFSGNSSKQTKERLSALANTNDGFEISRKDLELRGPGDFLGVRQHGLPDLKIANLLTDVNILKLSQTAAREILKEDRNLQKPEHKLLKNKLNRMFKGIIEGNVIG